MKLVYTSKRRFFALALMVHVLVLVCLCIRIFSRPPLAENTVSALPTYIVPASVSRPAPTVEKKVEARQGIKKAPPVMTQHQLAANHTDVIHKTIQAAAKKILDDPLLKLLHEVIAAKQDYPEEASLLNQSGTVRVGLRVFPDGHIENISVLQSSGVESLDSAAVSAVHSISTIKDAGLYIKTARDFSVDVVFQI